jgi:ribonuclease T2
LLLAAAAALAQNVSTTSFDLYILSQSWQPEFCYGTSYPGCAQPETYWKTHFTLHGLWPEYSNGGYPQSCTSEKFDSSVPDQIGWSTMTTYWPNGE